MDATESEDFFRADFTPVHSGLFAAFSDDGAAARFDYSTTMSEKHWTMPCLCGTPVCRGIIGDFHDLPDDLQHLYLTIVIVQPFIVEEWQARRTK